MAEDERMFNAWIGIVEPAISRFTHKALLPASLKGIEETRGSSPFKTAVAIQHFLGFEAVELAVLCQTNFPQTRLNEFITAWYPNSTLLIGIAVRELEMELSRFSIHDRIRGSRPQTGRGVRFQSKLSSQGYSLIDDKTDQALVREALADPREIELRRMADPYGIAERLAELGAIRYIRYAKHFPEKQTR